MARFDYPWHPLKLVLRCGHCCKVRTVERDSIDHPRASLVVTDDCDRCNHCIGGFPGNSYYDQYGNELQDDPIKPEERSTDPRGLPTSELIAIIHRHGGESVAVVAVDEDEQASA